MPGLVIGLDGAVVGSAAFGAISSPGLGFFPGCEGLVPGFVSGFVVGFAGAVSGEFASERYFNKSPLVILGSMFLSTILVISDSINKDTGFFPSSNCFFTDFTHLSNFLVFLGPTCA